MLAALWGKASPGGSQLEKGCNLGCFHAFAFCFPLLSLIKLKKISMKGTTCRSTSVRTKGEGQALVRSSGDTLQGSSLAPSLPVPSKGQALAVCNSSKRGKQERQHGGLKRAPDFGQVSLVYDFEQDSISFSRKCWNNTYLTGHIEERPQM